MSKWFLLGLATFLALLSASARALNLEGEIQKQKALLAESAQKEREILQELEALAQKIEAKRQEVERLQDEIATRELKLRALERALAAKDEALRRLEVLFRERLVALAMTGRIGWLNLLFAPGDIPTALRRSTYFQILLTHDQNLARTLLKEKEALVQEKRILAAEKRELARLRKQKEREVAVLEALRREKETLLAEVRRNISLYRETLENLTRAYQAIQNMAQELENTKKELAQSAKGVDQAVAWPSPAEAKGFILPPVQGVVERLFGLFVDPVTGQKIFQPGIFIAAPAGTPVRAPYDGRVVKVRFVRGQGLTLFLDHGYSFLSIIGGLGKVKVALGQVVKTGTVLGEVGERPFGKSGVYYEWRYKGAPKNPLDWLDTAKLHFLR